MRGGEGICCEGHMLVNAAMGREDKVRGKGGREKGRGGQDGQAASRVTAEWVRGGGDKVGGQGEAGVRCEVKGAKNKRRRTALISSADS